jgi:light-regulated signal transduction histidine kinase (bacteriophytochrome)
VKVIDSKGVITFDGERKPILLTGTVQDVTARKAIEESLRQNTTELERSNEQLQQFASIASHDLKEPLRKIGMFSNIIMTSEWDSLSERTKNNIQKISDAATRMQKLIEGVLSYSSVNAQLKKERVSLDQLLQEAISNLDYKIKETGAQIISEGLPEVEVIPLQIQQLFQNLLANALKFSNKTVTPKVKVIHQVLPADQIQDKNLRAAKEYLQIEVTDNGIGFDNEAAQKIFGLFRRLHNRSDYEGSGIGLAICKRIVENHGGTITAFSERGVGSTFTVLLPLL